VKRLCLSCFFPDFMIPDYTEYGKIREQMADEQFHSIATELAEHGNEGAIVIFAPMMQHTISYGAGFLERDPTRLAVLTDHGFYQSLANRLTGYRAVVIGENRVYHPEQPHKGLLAGLGRLTSKARDYNLYLTLLFAWRAHEIRRAVSGGLEKLLRR